MLLDFKFKTWLETLIFNWDSSPSSLTKMSDLKLNLPSEKYLYAASFICLLYTSDAADE